MIKEMNIFQNLVLRKYNGMELCLATLQGRELKFQEIKKEEE